MSIDSVCVLYCILFPFVNARTGWVDQGWKEPVHKASSHWREQQAHALRSGWPSVFGTRNLANGTGCTKIRQGNSWSIARQIHVLKHWSVRFQKDSVCQKESNFVSEAFSWCLHVQLERKDSEAEPVLLSEYVWYELHVGTKYLPQDLFAKGDTNRDGCIEADEWSNLPGVHSHYTYYSSETWHIIVR